MIRSTELAPHHSLPKQILALVLAWLAVGASMPPRALSSPLPAARPGRLATSLAAALPEPEPLAAEPAPLPSAVPQNPQAPAAVDAVAKAKADAKAEAAAKAKAKAYARPKSKAKADAIAGEDVTAKANSDEINKWGEITVGQPKIWQYERVNSLLDGLLRDVQGVSMSDLVSLDANATNGAAVKFVQSMLEIGVKYDQGAAVTNNIALQNFASSQGVASAQIEANKAYLQQLYVQRTNTTNELAAAMQLNNTLQGQLAATDPTTTAYQSLTTQQKAAASQVTNLQSDLSSINSQITAASTTAMPAAPSLTSTTPGNAPESANTFSSFLGNLPSDLTKNIESQLQTPSLPATKRMDNFITLLYERLAREISVLQDDVMRDPDNVAYLVQFDVGLYPGLRAKNHVGMVEFTMDCEGCKVYSVYPGQSSYNLANYEAASKRYSIWGALATIFGFGLSADYRRQTDTLHGDLVQSVYMSGFQEGAASTDRVGNEQVEQRFGWQYGSAPFEELVTPGIRSTFALISVPRALIASCGKKHGECPAGLTREFDKETGDATIGLKIDAHADWVRRDDPYKQQKDRVPPNSLFGTGLAFASWFSGSRLTLRDAGAYESKFLKVTLPGTEGVLNVPMVVRAERDRLHVLGMEYNPVYDAPAPQPANGAAVASTPPSPGTASATASGNGSGTTTVSVSGAGTASASSSGTASTTVTASAANPASTPSPSGSPSPTDPLTGCKLGQCASILIRLAEPLDPNLVVTVRGLPLQRVRDWRGRATSVLPPAQSASDFRSPAAALASGSSAALFGTENAPSASLLEADLPGPDTWMEVDSHRLMLTVSKNLVGANEEFPTIQILDPGKRALFLPLELDTGFSEVIMNGFHFPTRGRDQLQKYLNDHLRRQRSKSDESNPSGLHPTGPYAYETFLPLFLPRREPRPIYAYLGETGSQILVGFDKFQSGPAKTTPAATPRSWLAGRVQVVLEDRYLDLAWSLSCYPQGSILVCDVPREEIRDAYEIVKKLCVDDGGSPDEDPCPAITTSMEAYPSISTLQVWVEQYDPDGGNTFYSAVPARLGRFPVEADRKSSVTPRRDSGPDVGYRPWYFESASPNWVKLAGCNYPEFPELTSNDIGVLSEAVTILGRSIPRAYQTQILRPENGCKWFLIPTIALTSKEVVLEYPPAPASTKLTFEDLTKNIFTVRTNPPPSAELPLEPKDPVELCGKFEKPCLPESLATALFQPSFDDPIAIPKITPSAGSAKTPRIESWTIDLPVRHVDCNDSLNIGLPAYWKIGGVPRIKVRDLNDPTVVPCKTKIHDSLFESAIKAKTKTKSDEETAKNDAARAGNDAAAIAKAGKEKTKAQQETKDAETLNASAGKADAVAPDWDEASKTGQLMLEFEFRRVDLDKLPIANSGQLLRGSLLSKIATLPDLRPSFLPTKLTVVTEGPNQFALQGDNAGVIDAVTVQGPDGTVVTVNAVSAGNIANITLPAPAKTQDKTATPAKSAIKEFPVNSVPAGTKVEISGSNFGADPGTVRFGTVTAPVGLNCWLDGSITLDVPPGVPAGSVKVTVTPKAKGATAAQATFIVAGNPLARAESVSCPAIPAPASDNQAGSKAGAYSIVPLIAISGGDQGAAVQYLPLDVTDPAGKPLSFTATEQKSSGSNAPKGVDSPTTTLTISKKTTVTPPATSTSSGQ